MKIRDKNTAKYINSICYLKMFGCYDDINNNTFFIFKTTKTYDWINTKINFSNSNNYNNNMIVITIIIINGTM